MTISDPRTDALVPWSCDGLRFLAYPGTTDEKALDEVVKRRVYLKHGIDIRIGEQWLDLGGNIGAFTVLAASYGARVTVVEPEPSNLALLQTNLDLNGLTAKLEQAVVMATSDPVKLYLCTNPNNRYRHTTRPTRGRQAVPVRAIAFADLLTPGLIGIKMDIEGAEHGILDATDNWQGVTKLAFEYHFTPDRSLDHFHQRIARLRNHFPIIHHPRVALTGQWAAFPDAIIVHCRRPD